MKAIILAAGFGTRLFPLTIDRTKPAIPFLGKPLVGYVAEYLAGFGFKEVVVNLHHQPDSVKDALGDGTDYGVNIHYTEEVPNILGTAGALDNAKDHLKDETFLIINGKIITDIDISAVIEHHRSSGSLATMVLKPNEKREKFTEVIVKDGLVKGFGDFATPVTEDELKGDTAEIKNPLMFTGIHILEPAVFDYIPEGIYSDIVPTFYNPAIRAGEKISAFVTNSNWFELSTIPRYLDISLAMMQSGNVFIGRDAKIEYGANIRDSVIWDNVTIPASANLYRTIIADNVVIEPEEHFENVAIVTAEMVRNCDEIPEKALKGYIKGENYIVPLN